MCRNASYMIDFKVKLQDVAELIVYMKHASFTKNELVEKSDYAYKLLGKYKNYCHRKNFKKV